MADDENIKLTAYGYPGDATPDSYSEAHIGDRDNQLTATADHQSVALTESEREARFGVSGKSTGMSFTYEGKTYYDDDTAPESDRRIDVFDPSHPPDVPVSGRLRSAPRLLPERAERYDATPSLADAPEPPEEKPEPKRERPVDSIRKNYPEYADLPDEKLVPKLQAVFPDVPQEKLKVYATQPGGAQMIRQYQDRNLSPLEKFRKYYAGLSSGDDEKDLEWMRTHFYPGMGPMQFKAFADPPPAVLTFIGHLYDQMTSGTVGAVEALVNPSKSPIGTGSPFNKGVEAGAQATLGKWEQFPKAAMDAMDNLQKAAGVYGWKQSASDWLDKNVAGYGGARDWFRNFINNLNARGKQFEAQSQQIAGSIPSNQQIPGTIGQVLGQAPDAAVSFGLGTSGRAAALWGMMYEGISAYGHAIENHQKNALLQGVTSAGFRQFAQYLLNTGKGRIVSGIANSFATVADQEIEKWARGEPNDITKDGKAATVGLLVGLLMGRRKAPEPLADVPQETQEVTAQSILGPTRGELMARIPSMEEYGRTEEPPPIQVQQRPANMAARTGFVEELPERAEFAQKQAARYPKETQQISRMYEESRTQAPPTGLGRGVFFSAPAMEELLKAEEAHHNGDHDAAADYIDRTFSLMPDKEKRAVAQDFIDKVDALAGEPGKKTLSPEDKLFNDYYFSGFGFKPGRHNKFAQEESKEKEAGWRPQGSPLTGLKPGRDIRGYPLTYGQQDLIREVQRYRDNDQITDEEYERVVGEVHRTRVDQLPEIRKSIQFSNPQYEMHENEGNYTITKNGNALYGTSNKQTAEKYFERLKSKQEENPLPPGYFKDNPEGEQRYQAMSPEDQARYRKHLASQDGRFYSGVPFAGVAKGIKDWFESNRPGLPLFPASPEEVSEGAERAGAIIKSEEGRSVAAGNVGQGKMYREAVGDVGPMSPLRKFSQNVIGLRIGLPNEPAVNLFEKISGLRFGDPMERMDRFFHNFSKAELIQQFIDYQDGKPIKDPNAKWIWENVIGPTYDAIEKREHDYNIEYEHRDNYFLQLLTHPKRDLPRLQESMARSGMGLMFTKPREMKLVERLALGHEMITINPIRLMQLRWWSGDRAIQKIRDIKQLEAQGLAFNAALKGKNIPPALKPWINEKQTFNTPDKQSYYVHPDVIGVLNKKFDPRDLFRTAGGPIFKFVAALKGTVAAKVSFSLFHPLHIMDITQADVATDAFQRVLAGKANWSDAANLALNEVPFVGSLPTMTRAYLKYADAVNCLKQRMDFDQLTPDQQRDVKDFIDMGLVVDTSQERQMQFTKWLQENGPGWIRKGGWPVKVAFDVLGNPLGFNKWWFGTVTPRLKFASAMMRRDTLALTRPDLFRASKRMERLQEFQKFHRDIEGRYGEMHYDNLLWPRMLKQTGTTFMLSLGWQLGMFRTMGDGVIDLTRNQAHWGEILKGWQTRDPAARHLITNRMVFTGMYVARGLAAGWAITYFVGHKNPFAPGNNYMWDGVYPVVGKDAQGKEKRVNMQYFYKDVPQLIESSRMEGSVPGGLFKMATNKIQPMLSAVIQAANNKDYMGHVIGDYPARIGYVLGHGIEPISFENAGQPGMTDSDKLMSILGFAPSGRWTMRSDLENKIVSEAMEARNYGPLLDARDQYRQAYLAKDHAAMKAAHDQLIKMQVTEKQIRTLQKNADKPIGHRLFQQLLPMQQENLWKEMSRTEHQEYWPFVKKELKASGRIKM